MRATSTAHCLIAQTWPLLAKWQFPPECGFSQRDVTGCGDSGTEKRFGDSTPPSIPYPFYFFLRRIMLPERREAQFAVANAEPGAELQGEILAVLAMKFPLREIGWQSA